MSDETTKPARDVYRDESYWKMVAGVFKGTLGWTTWVVFIYSFVFFGICIWSAMEFFDVEPSNTKDCIMYATIFAVSALLVMVCKMWFWTQILRNSMLRRIDHLEKKCNCDK